MDKYERYKNVPHFDLIQENETITIPSIFQFKGGCTELFSFRQACKDFNCTVIFDNENLIMKPDGTGSHSALLSMCALIAEEPKIAEDYIQYLTKVSTGEMSDSL